MMVSQYLLFRWFYDNSLQLEEEKKFFNTTFVWNMFCKLDNFLPTVENISRIKTLVFIRVFKN